MPSCRRHRCGHNPNSCFFGWVISATFAEFTQSKKYNGWVISAKVAEITQSKRLFEKFSGGVRFGGESWNCYCRSVLFRFTVLRRKIGFGGGFTVSNRRFLFSRFWFLGCAPLGLAYA